MYSYYNQNIERINQQINDLERARNQMQMQQPTNLTQNFQISPQQQGIKFVNGIDEVEKELVLNETMYGGVKYFLVMGVDKNKDVIPTNVAIVEEIIDGNDTYVDRVRDPELIIILTRILKSQM